ncbi:hypothetical protein Sfulv_57410 [Streptomyces fulvorobeus]|uniref:Uncharacterized protein n=1 Tax=Streptomyces fulvorobeus TaxID=284028 RepID=A0A7J0CEJ9_9ACTN|nr:hypothetical protein Sfulv_57410 [Streptomyces fulvorobeus]
MIIPIAQGMADSSRTGFRTGSVVTGVDAPPDSDRCSAYVDMEEAIPSKAGGEDSVRCGKHARRAGGRFTLAQLPLGHWIIARLSGQRINRAGSEVFPFLEPPSGRKDHGVLRMWIGPLSEPFLW